MILQTPEPRRTSVTSNLNADTARTVYGNRCSTQNRKNFGQNGNREPTSQSTGSHSYKSILKLRIPLGRHACLHVVRGPYIKQSGLNKFYSADHSSQQGSGKLGLYMSSTRTLCVKMCKEMSKSIRIKALISDAEE